MNEGSKRTVVIGFFGSTLDTGRGARRWGRWRPTLSLFQHDDLLVDRLELLCQQPGMAETLLGDLRETAPETTVNVHKFELQDAWDFGEVYSALHDFARSYPFDLEHERYLIHLTTGTHVAQICLFLLTETGFFPGLLVQTGPPTGKQRGPSRQLIDLDLSRYDQIAKRFEVERQRRAGDLRAGIATKNQAYNGLIDQIERVAHASAAPILLTGPTGVGKTQLARRIYGLKRRQGQLSGPLVEVNCATLRGDQAMSTLFGHTRGAFTGAVSDRRGLLAGAHRGVLFLDEIGELGADEQAMLLSAIEDKRFTPVGSEKVVESDFQLIAGTNSDLGVAAASGRFRADLLARINLWRFVLPTLAERREDIGPNIAFELDRIAEATHRRVNFNAEARRRFLRFAESLEATWDNNFRDLGAAITRMATLAEGGRITVANVDGEIARLRATWTWTGASGGQQDCPHIAAKLGADAAAAMDLFDRQSLEGALEVCATSPSLAAAGRRLFAVSRLEKTSRNDADRLRKYLARFGLDGRDVLRDADG